MSEIITASLTVSGGDTITAEINTLARGPAGTGGGGSNSVTSATTSDGTANLSISNVTTATATVSGIMTAPTAATTTSTTQVATTAFVQQELASGVAVARNLEFLAHNGSGATILKGSIVYVNGAVGGVPRITKAQANNDTNSARTIGFAKADIANGANGFVIIEGELLNVSTADSIDIIGAGIQLYLSPTTPGAFTRTKPSAPQHIVYVGVVVTASTGANLDGKIIVGIQNGYELNEIHDVSITAPVAKQVVKRNAGNTLWVNEAIVSADVSDATSAATADKLVLRDGTGGANFAGTVNLNTGVIVDLQFEDYQAAVGATFTYGAGADAAHRTALGSGATGDELFTAASASAARTTLELGSTNTPTFGGLDLLTATTTTLNVYNTLSGANFERLSFRWASNIARIGTAKGGTGTARDLVLETDGTERMRVLSTGNVGIGTTSPARKLSIEGSLTSGADNFGIVVRNTNSAGYSELSFNNDTVTAGGAFVFGYGGSATANANEAYFFQRRNAALLFGTNNTTRMLITGGGNVGIYATTASTNTTTGALVVSGGVGIAGAVNANSLALTAPLPITSGGTGAITAPLARTALGSGATGDELFTAGSPAVANTLLANNVVTKAADFTLAEADAGTYMRLTKTGTAQTITLPTSNISTGAEFQFYRATTQSLAFAGSATVNGTANLASVPNNGAFALKHLGSGTYDFI